jgi:phosphomannomutase
MAGRFVHDILKTFKGESLVLNDNQDGSFPAHGPNPSAEGSLDQLREKVLDFQADIGFCFDGDADRVVIVDEKGNPVSPDIVTALLGVPFLGEDRERVLVDVRSSNSIPEYIRSLGGDPLYCPVGHARIKKMLRDENAVYGGELTGHYYYRENFFCDSAWITVFAILRALTSVENKLSEMSRNLMKYSFSGELSYEVSDQSAQDEVLNRLNEIYSDASINTLDGLRFNYDDWWFIVRKSGTEPLLRLVVEASTEKKLDEKVRIISDEILRIR